MAAFVSARLFSWPLRWPVTTFERSLARSLAIILRLRLAAYTRAAVSAIS